MLLKDNNVAMFSNLTRYNLYVDVPVRGKEQRKPHTNLFSFTCAVCSQLLCPPLNEL